MPVLSPAVEVTLTVNGRTEEFYQPIEGGWRVHGEDGPLRHNRHGLVRTFLTLEEAAAAMIETP